MASIPRLAVSAELSSAKPQESPPRGGISVYDLVIKAMKAYTIILPTVASLYGPVNDAL